MHKHIHCSLKCFLEGGGVDIILYVSKFVSRIHNCHQTDKYKTEDSKKNRLIGYIVTLIHSDKLLWENVMNYATLYSLKCFFEGGGVLLVFDIYIYVKFGLTPP